MPKPTYRIALLIIFIQLSVSLYSQVIDKTKCAYFYQTAFDKLSSGIQTPGSLNFKDAVFATENAFWQEQIQYEHYESKIANFVELIKLWKASNKLRDYRYKDSGDFINNYSIFTLLKDTITIIANDVRTYAHFPMTYDFQDFSGHVDWSNMFVTKLMATNTGNCHSFPYLYKILADELGANCWLSLAPNHLYIKNRCKKIGWYNTELTSGEFPIDAWITASGYIPLQAIQNGIYMDTLSNQQAIGLCVLDLAKGYEFLTKNYYDGFIIKCCDLVLQYHPMNVQAMLLKAETLKRVYEKQQKDTDEIAPTTYHEMEGLYVKLFELGYREMPEQMYMDWLKSVTHQQGNYNNKKVKAVIPVKKK